MIQNINSKLIQNIIKIYLNDTKTTLVHRLNQKETLYLSDRFNSINIMF